MPPAKNSSVTKKTEIVEDVLPSVSEGGSRRFEFRDGSSCKFWEITGAGADVTVCFGRIGTDGQTQTKSFADFAAAKKHADKLVAEKTKKGYVPVA